MIKGGKGLCAYLLDADKHSHEAMLRGERKEVQ